MKEGRVTVINKEGHLIIDVPVWMLLSLITYAGIHGKFLISKQEDYKIFIDGEETKNIPKYIMGIVQIF